MSWLSDRLGIRLDSHTLGNLVKNVSPAAALIPGVGPATAALLAGGGSAVGDALRGKSPDLGSALTNAGLSYGLGSVLGGGGGAGANLRDVLPDAPPPPQPGILSRVTSGIGDKAGDLASFAEHHPTAAAGALQGIGQLSSLPAQGAQARLLNTQADQAAYDLKRKQSQDKALEGLRQQLAAIIGQSVAQPGYGQVPR